MQYMTGSQHKCEAAKATVFTTSVWWLDAPLQVFDGKLETKHDQQLESNTAATGGNIRAHTQFQQETS